MKLVDRIGYPRRGGLLPPAVGRLGPRGGRPPAAVWAMCSTTARATTCRPTMRPKQVHGPAQRAERQTLLRARQLRHRGGPDGAGISRSWPITAVFPVGRPAGLRHARPRVQHRAPAAALQAGDILLHGHTHVPAWQAFGNDNHLPRTPAPPPSPRRTAPHGLYDAERRRVYVENAGRGEVSRSKSVSVGAGYARPMQRTRCRGRRPRRPAEGAPPLRPHRTSIYR